MVRSQEEVATEIARLKELHGLIPSHNAFGDSNLVLIDAQIGALERLDFGSQCEEDEEDDDGGDGACADIESAVFVAEDWYRDAEADNEKPSEGWEDLVGVTVTPIERQ